MALNVKKTLPYLLTFAGILLFTFLSAKAGIDPVYVALKKVGLLGFFALVIIQLIINFGLGVSWKASTPKIALSRLTMARFVRDAASTCLPFSQLGGMLAGLKATVCEHPANPKNRVSWAEAIASNIIDITSETLGQIVFIILAILCLIGHQDAGKFIIPLIAGILILTIGISSFIWSQHKSGNILAKIGYFLSRHIAASWHESFKNKSDSFQNALDDLWKHPKNIAYGAFIHLIFWLGSAVITWVGLHFLGANISIFNAIAIEGVVCGMMTVGFLVPAALGVQEGAYIALGLVFGVSTDISFSLSLLRRGRDIVIGVPVLLLWQIAEIRHIRNLKETSPSK
ncbi:HpnL family protein [Aristophania vespae]|uniref:HpnL family protein n=1 Tax=Aristophania vespae TaxID=2697033 RepID=A0A6P1ND69_9PROT|nr:lysylphosphatidylglycerol synthase domain-containing protein [Aristophania vespae]QHI95423.1 HpnL family protein [Aristophania vespae]